MSGYVPQTFATEGTLLFLGYVFKPFLLVTG